MKRIGFLGPNGTFSEKALRSRPEAGTAESVPYRAVDVALQALRDGDIDGAVVPIENSVEGGVPATLDALVSGTPLVVVGEMVIPVSFVLAARPGVTLAEVKSVGTHPHAWAQIRGWVGANLNDAAFDIGDNKRAVTRFVLVSRPGHLPEPTGRDKTTLTLFQEHDRPGALLELLEQFKTRGINLTRLESRPTGESLGRYCFSVDLEGHVLEERVGEALAGLKRICLDIRFLGSYPRADDVAGQVPDGFDDYSYQSAARWLLAVRGGRSPIRAIG